MQVTVQPRKADGSPWDALGGAPDIAACFNIDGKPTGCVPDAARGPKCRDAMSCEFRVHARRDAVVMVSVVDVDEMSNDDIGHCNFVAGRGAADCRGQLSLAPEGVDSPAAGGVIDLRIVGWWEVDVEGTIAQFPDSAKLSIEQRKAVIEEMSAGPGAGYFEFNKEGRVSAKVGEELTEGTYVIIGLKGKVLTVELREGEEVETVEITVVDTGLLVKQGEQALALRRAR